MDACENRVGTFQRADCKDVYVYVWIGVYSQSVVLTMQVGIRLAPRERPCKATTDDRTSGQRLSSPANGFLFLTRPFFSPFGGKKGFNGGIRGRETPHCDCKLAKDRAGKKKKKNMRED